MLFSIITVSFNSKSNINVTLDSIYKQTYDNYELIVIDGASNDGSQEVFAEYNGKIHNLTIISEPDFGIYNAMNKGVRMAKGEYIFFLNLGDVFHNDNILEKIANIIECSCSSDIIYGDVVLGNRVLNQPRRLNSLFFLSERMICHQSIFAKRSLLNDNGFDEHYKICADRVWMIRSLRNGATYKKVDLIIVNYDTNGISSDYNNFDSDSISATRNCYGNWAVVFVKLKRFIGRIFCGNK